jgi:FlaA1/EpsC-like NDP-sugar epimerase
MILDNLATFRDSSLFEEAIRYNSALLIEKLKGARVLIVGAAGSIGSATTKKIAYYPLKNLTLIDICENNLAELVRDLRSSRDLKISYELTTIPIGIGSKEFDEFINRSKPFDYVLNFSALKHVRSERSIYSISRMFETNFLCLDKFLNKVPYNIKSFFSISSDKAVNPANFLGASKNIMEQIMWKYSGKHNCTSSRFANVAFSDGSLLYSFIKRLQKEQPLVAPNDIQRYFISHEEAAQLCILSAFASEKDKVLIPSIKSNLTEEPLSKILESFLEFYGYKPYYCDNEEQAKEKVLELKDKKLWPCMLQKSNTSGEKKYEEFYYEWEYVNKDIYPNISTVNANYANEEELNAFLNFCRSDSFFNSTRMIIAEKLKTIVRGFEHFQSDLSLDDKM